MEHQSSSHEQRAAEAIILAGAAEQLGVDLSPATFNLPGGARIDVDGASAQNAVLVEVFAHQGRLRGGQFHKVARDALKLITAARGRDVRLAIAFGDDDAATCVTGRSWLAEALRTWGVEVLVVDVDEKVRASVRAAQLRQVMVNSPGPDEEA